VIRHLIRRRGLGAALALSIALLVAIGAPAHATEGERHCIGFADDGTVVCASTLEGADDAFTAATGRTRVESGDAARGALVAFSLATLYANTGYTGSSFTVTRSTDCNGVTISGVANLATVGLDNAVSSFLAFGSCQVRLSADPNYAGAQFGFATSRSSLPTFNDVASSARVR
jgi:hypothetical protein